jgi:hypothetical protein
MRETDKLLQLFNFDLLLLKPVLLPDVLLLLPGELFPQRCDLTMFATCR